MSLLEDNVRDLMCDRYGSVKAFADTIGMPSRTLYSALEKGLGRTSLSTIMPICKGLGLSPEDVFYKRFVPSPAEGAPFLVPVFESVTARKPMQPQSAAAFQPISARLHTVYPDAFLMRVKDDAMDRLLPDGALVLVNPCEKIEASNQFYAVAIDGREAAIRMVEILNNGLRLNPYSHDPTYQKVVLDYNDPDTPPAHVIGRAVWFCADIA